MVWRVDLLVPSEPKGTTGLPGRDAPWRFGGWKEMVGASGFEPPASWSRTRRASQAALRPEGVAVDRHSLRWFSVGSNRAHGRYRAIAGSRAAELRNIPQRAKPVARNRKGQPVPLSGTLP